MVHIPFVPARYPDENLGSWFARIALHNGRGAWRSILEATDNGQQLQTPMFDMVDYEDKLGKLLKAFGVSYESAIIELTTLPYWLAFDAASMSRGPLRGTSATPKLVARWGTDARSLSSRGVARGEGKSPQLRYCPKCLDYDHTACGEPYWHRAHQLPNVFFCPDHDCALHTTCPRCKLAIVAIATRLADLPRLRCACGYDLRRATPSAPPQSAHLKLAKFSAQALNAGKPRWDGHQVRTHLRSLLSARTDMFAGRYQSLLASTFRLTGIGGPRLWGEIPALHGSRDKKWSLSGNLGLARAPECCALFVALDIEFDQAARAFLRVTSGRDSVARSERVKPDSLTIKSARREMARRVSAYPKLDPASHRQIYWFLRLHDAQWLRQHVPNVRANPIPSIEDDRKQLRRVLSDSKLVTRRRREIARKISAGLRAQYRDRTWFRERLKQHRNEHLKHARTIRDGKRNSRVSALEIALQKLLRSEGRPARIGPRALAALVGIAETQARRAIQSHPPLRDAIAAANDGKLYRQLLWAVRQMMVEGLPLAMAAIARRAGVSHDSKMSALAREIVLLVKE